MAVATARAKRKAGIRRAEVALFELDADALTPLASRTNVFTPLPTYPVVEFDISLIVPRAVRWTETVSIAAADPLVRSVTFVDEYTGAQVPEDHKSLTLRLHLGSDEGTLVREQIDTTAAKVIEALTGRLGGGGAEGGRGAVAGTCLFANGPCRSFVRSAQTERSFSPNQDALSPP